MTRPNGWFLLRLWPVWMLLACACHGGNLKVSGLKCEYRINPLGIDAPQPRLSWVLESDRPGEVQTAYQIMVASSAAKLARNRADLWDSGKVASSESIHVTYEGRPLRSGQRAFWKVRVWDRADKGSDYSQTAWFEMALLTPSDWQAKWIQRPPGEKISEAQMFDDHPAPLLRKEFTIDKKIARARAYVSGLGYYELHLNGQRVGEQVLDPGWTSYSKRVLYSTYDVTTQLKRGSNAAGIMLGSGWFNPLPLAMWGHIKPGDALTTGEPRAILQLVIEFTDGTTQTVVTDESWRIGNGPILRNSVYLGEVYDARREQRGWDQPGFGDAHWPNAAIALKPALGRLHAQDAPPIRITRTLKPVKLTEPKPGIYIFDFGQNFSGWTQLRVQGEAGTRVRLRSGELLYPDGTLNGMTAVTGQIKDGGKDYRYDGIGKPKTAFQLDEYVLRGQGLEVYTPRFTFHGFRYVEVTGFPGRPTLDSLTGLRLNSDVPVAGSFECSNELFNRIQQMVLWTELANVFSVQSDCPHREKFGYGGDIVASSEMAMLNFDMSRFYAKAAQDLLDDVRPNGGFTETAPYVGIADEGLGDKSGPIGWGTAEPLLLCQLRQYYGDRRLLEQQYEVTKRWIALLNSRAKDGILDNGISDHESLAPKPRALTGTAFYFYNLKLFAQIAKARGNESDAADAEIQADRVRAAFNQKFLQPGTGRYDTATQACQAFALFMGLAPADEIPRALDFLVRNIREECKGHLSTGIFGTKYMLNALTDLGQAGVAFEIVNQRTFPGWGHMLENGATTLWEHWEFSDNTFSHNHPMFGSVSEWFYKALAGIKPAPEAVGFDKIIIHPQWVGDLKWVKAHYDSIRGKIVSEWNREPGQFQLRVRIPVGASATVCLPAQDPDRITVNGKPIGHNKDVQLLRNENGTSLLAIGSGEYRFVSAVP
ncbi:MAG TPA: family 78 glycoside hydrolase catalytic domain [Candidatus Paceibacterota bacterium]|nr:family 78 glycoside hydrolase catalytic domain [Candidatus Paceibacterota bacterium]